MAHRIAKLDEFGEVKISIKNVEYSIVDDEPVIHIFGRDENRRLRRIDVFGFEPYFYVPEEEEIEDFRIKRIEEGYTGIDGKRLKKIVVRRPSDVRELRGKFSRSYEADILFTQRFLIDSGLRSAVRAPSERVHYSELKPSDEPNVESRILIIDIECNDERGFPDPKRDEIICVTAWDSYSGDFETFLLGEASNARCYEDEREMLSALFRFISERDPDILTGWNFSQFDMPYLYERARALKVDVSPLSRLRDEDSRIRGRSIFDLLEGYRKIQGTQKESYRLDAVAEEELGERKVKFRGSLSELWKNDPEKLVEYNRKDVELCVKINEKNNIIRFFEEVANLVGCSLEDTLNSSRIIDVYVLRKAKNRYVLPSKPQGDFDSEYEGAMVLEPIRGVKENVVVLDLKSLYPMILMTLNASPETKDENGEIVAPNGVRFRKHPESLTREILRELIELRDERKRMRDRYEYGSEEYRKYDLQQTALKVIANSYYGVSGYPRFRLYDREIASAVTSVGREIIKHTKRVIESLGYEVVYGDTDSCMVSLGEMPVEEVVEKGKELERILNKSYDEFARTLNADRHFFQIKFEKVYRRFFQVGRKKRYAGHLVWKEGKWVDDIDIVGFEFRRSDFPKLTKRVQKDVITMIIKGESIERVGEYLRDVLKKFYRGEFSLDEIGIPGGLGKDLDDYENEDAHVRGALYANKYLGKNFGRGSKPKRVYIKRVPEGFEKTDVICFEDPDEIPEGFVIDLDKMAEKILKQPIDRILRGIGYSWSEVENGNKQMRLDELCF
ncbi:MAG: polymerase, archaea type [Archaeoglobi archaeon]|nr:ribonuclease H-like domain-containing protein [Candidatus Mnemosynella bozhongmuii]MDI3502398.1 polymerase, archaea type [Archaeoglobi archaeon]MDK2781672.1 polymerase, archaea type [Archaeoglobi archaeon]